MTTFYLPIDHDVITGAAKLGAYPFQKQAYLESGLATIRSRHFDDGTIVERRVRDMLYFDFKPKDESRSSSHTYCFKIVTIADVEPEPL